MFGWEFPPFQAGGLATATVGLVKGLLRSGTEVTLVVPFPADASPMPDLRLVSADGPGQDQLVVHRIPSPMAPYGGAEAYQEIFSRIRQQPRRQAGPVYGADLFQEVARYASLAGEIAAREPHDVIDTHDWITFAAGIEARKVSGKPLVAHIHATEFDRAGDGANPEICRREYEGMMAADRIVANSHALRRTCVERYGIPAHRIDVVHWGIDGEGFPAETPREDFFASAARRRRRVPVVLFLGRVTWQKGPDYFIEMAGRVSRHVPEAKFIVAGQGDMLPHLIRRSAELGIAGRVHFAGGVGGTDVHRLYRLADVCVMPSVSEPFGLVALESLRNGTPCIIPKNAGVAEAVTNAFKVDFWDVDAMTNQIVALIRYPVLREELSRNGLAEVQGRRFSLEEPARRTAASYEAARRGS
ncbi:MAG TPA: glycosyltransferase family 4 protein [Gemmatimonadales bacterium]|nr:glycosyltransferase family 4 protein [Gemmatimonadales bacterium]